MTVTIDEDSSQRHHISKIQEKQEISINSRNSDLKSKNSENIISNRLKSRITHSLIESKISEESDFELKPLTLGYQNDKINRISNI